MSAAARRCPTARESVEIRITTVPGAVPGERDVVLRMFVRAGHDLDAPWRPAPDVVVRVPGRYAERLAELILQAATEATETAETETRR